MQKLLEELKWSPKKRFVLRKWFESVGLSLDRISQDSESKGERERSFHHQLKYVW